ncbi:MAG: DUF5686 and carboxypeptidase regulatory-like domain-containing protein [Chitinophagales bacterium]|nr:DUF5686 and carboxypeptidase regulatory-like domain-containing protein [Chitinophagales bacterium]
MVSPFFSAAQIFSLNGTVTDSITGEKLPFVTILTNLTGSIGTSSDSAGNFSVKSNEPITALRLSYVGYNSKTMSFGLKDKTSNISIQLSSQEQQLEDFTVIGGENPANRIIKLAVKNRDQNNYAKLNSYSFTAYEKFTFTGIPPKGGYSDSMRTKLFRYLGDNHFLIMESVVDRKHLAPDLIKETVLAQKVSGLKNPNFTLLTSQFQTTNFYEPYLSFATTDFVNPISPNSWDKYFFNVEDTLMNGNDTVFTVSYHPEKGKHFASLIGSLEINTDGYAIQNVTAEVSDTGYALLFVKIEQRYAKVDSVHWFPTYLGTNIGFKNFLFEGLKVEMQGSTFIKDPVINLPLTKKDFDGVNIDLMDNLNKSDDYWIQNRADTLTVKEKKTYVLLDSLNHHYHFDRKLAWANSLQDGLFRFPYLSVQIYNTIKFNKPEGVRLGLGLQTNSDFSKKYILSAFAGYGLGDGLWKYGGGVKWKIYEPKNIALTVKASMNYEENGGLDFFQGGYYGSGSGTRNYTIANFDFVDRKEIDFTARLRKYVNVQASGFTTFKRVTNDYEFLNTFDGEPHLMNEFHYTGVQAAVRFSYKEKVVESLEHFYWINTGYPTIWLQVTQGFKGLLNGDFNYTKYEARFNYYFNTKSFGITSFTIEGGIVDGILPSTELYAGKSSYSPFGLYAPGSFQTMRSGEFMSDRFASLYFKQDFLKNVLQRGNFQPNFLFVTNIGWGILSHPETHVNAAFQSMQKGYFESGIVANNLLARKFAGIVRLGVGVGVFYRYGSYSFSNELDNFAFKGTLSYYFK